MGLTGQRVHVWKVSGLRVDLNTHSMNIFRAPVICMDYRVMHQTGMTLPSRYLLPSRVSLEGGVPWLLTCCLLAAVPPEAGGLLPAATAHEEQALEAG